MKISNFLTHYSLSNFFTLNSFIILIFLLTILSAISIILVKNPIHSVFFLVLVFFNVALLLIVFEVEFLALVFLVVYIGAICVLFLFVIMMINIRIVILHEVFIRYIPIGALFLITLVLEVYIILKQTLNLQKTIPSLQNKMIYLNNGSNIELIGNILYNYNFTFLFLSGLILLVSIIGAISLTNLKMLNSKKQNSFKQVNVKYKNILYLSIIILFIFNITSLDFKYKILKKNKFIELTNSNK